MKARVPAGVYCKPYEPGPPMAVSGETASCILRLMIRSRILNFNQEQVHGSVYGLSKLLSFCCEVFVVLTLGLIYFDLELLLA